MTRHDYDVLCENIDAQWDLLEESLSNQIGITDEIPSELVGYSKELEEKISTLQSELLSLKSEIGQYVDPSLEDLKEQAEIDRHEMWLERMYEGDV